MSSYFSLIPSGIMQNQKISDSSKITYALILGLSNRYGYCYAPNSYLSEQRGLSESGIKRHLAELKDNNCITLEYNEKNDRRITPIIYPAVREKQLQASKNKQFGRYDIDEVSQALDTLWKKMR
jgi:DNA-binding MarR family transcriptional regulator